MALVVRRCARTLARAATEVYFDADLVANLVGATFLLPEVQ